MTRAATIVVGGGRHGTGVASRSGLRGHGVNAAPDALPRGRVALVTGANTGIGLVTARELAARGVHVFVACRSAERAQQALASIRPADGTPRPEALALDLGDLASVRRC